MKHKCNFDVVSFASMGVLVIWGPPCDWRPGDGTTLHRRGLTVQTGSADTSDWLSSKPGNFGLIVSYHSMKVMKMTSNCPAGRKVEFPSERNDAHSSWICLSLTPYGMHAYSVIALVV